MKKNFLILVMSFSAVTLIAINGCKKSAGSEADYTADFTVQSEDQTFVSAEDDAVSNDANTLVESDVEFGGGRTENTICDATITHSTTATTKVLTVTYTGQSCAGNHTRTGMVIITLPKEKRWKDAGAQLSITYQNLKITRTGDKKSIVLNGTKIITNVSGGEIGSLALLRTITHSITSSALSITFDDGTKRDWQISKQRVFTYNNGIVISTRGTHAEGTALNISEWGTNRLGKPFITQIAEPLVIRQDCDFRLVSGKIVYANLQSPVTITFGLNATGAATSCPVGTDHYYYKVDWTGLQNVAHSIILPY